MPTVDELKGRLDTERGKFAEFQAKHTKTVGGVEKWNFAEGEQGDADRITFNNYQGAMKTAFDAWDAQRIAETQATELEAKMAAADREGASPRLRSGGVYNGDGSGAEQQQAPQSAAFKSLGQQYVESDAYKAHKDKTLASFGKNYQFEVILPNGGAAIDAAGEAVGYAIKADPYTAASGVLPFPAVPGRRVEFATRRPVMRNLLPVQDTTRNGQKYMVIPVVRETTQDMNADEVPEGTLKPRSEIGEERDNISLITIGTSFSVTNQALDFIIDLRERIDRKGTLDLMQAEESKMLNYNGSAGWKGLMVQTGVQDDAKGGSDHFTAFLRAVTLVETGGVSATGSYAQATGFAIHNFDWLRVATLKDLQNRFIYGDPSAVTPAVRLWGIPGIKTPVATEGTIVVGDFASQAVWWESGGTRILTGYVDDDLRRNKMTIVIEEYGALEIDLYSAFVRQTGWQNVP